MTKVFVHGNPETPAVWRLLVAELAALGVEDVVTLAPPGFGAPLDGFDPTAENYVTWLHEQVRAIDGPIDLVGHDWGTGHVLGLVASQPESVRSWAADILGLIHPDYVWHDAAQSWRTPGDGEAAMEVMTSLPKPDLTGVYEGLGLPSDIAADLAAGMNQDMATAILRLYRSAGEDELEALGRRMADSSVPGLAINATGDPYVNAGLTASMAHTVGAEQLVLDGHGHWWMTSAQADAAAGLAAFWAGLD